MSGPASTPSTPHMMGKMVVISGPSGSGKSTICKRLLVDPRIVFSVSATTRKQRQGEIEGRDYHFLTRDEFRRRVERGEFIEHAEVYGNMYGTLRAPMQRALAEGKVYLLEIDVQGALQLRALGEPGIYVFIAPPDFEELRRRLVKRNTETAEMLERRLHKAEDEYRERVKYDHVVVNDELDRAVSELRRILGLECGETAQAPQGGGSMRSTESGAAPRSSANGG
jgi:guanylate kinase